MSEATLPEWTVLLEDGTVRTFESDDELLAAFQEGDFSDVVARAVDAVRGWNDVPVIPLEAAAGVGETRVFFADGTSIKLERSCRDFPTTPIRAQPVAPTVLRSIPCAQQKVSGSQKLLLPGIGTQVLLADVGWNNRAHSGRLF